jgi:hypothetical protein
MDFNHGKMIRILMIFNNDISFLFVAIICLFHLKKVIIIFEYIYYYSLG